jgi:DNA-binding transcriptional ArsR family regulator
MPNLDIAFSALADPTRRAILARLATGEATVMELAEPFAVTQPAISRHLKVLEGAGLIVRRVEGTKRPCRLAPAGIDAVDQWLAMLREALAKNYDCKFRSFRQAISVQTGRRFRWKPTGRFGPKRHPVADGFWSRLWRTAAA